MNELIPYVHISDTVNESFYYFKQFAKTEARMNNIKHFNTLIPYKLMLKDNICIYFMTAHLYKQWCFGRTYKFLGDETVYCSGCRVRQVE